MLVGAQPGTLDTLNPTGERAEEGEVQETAERAAMWTERGLLAAGTLFGSAIGLLDESMHVVWVSASFVRIFGFDPTGSSALELLHPDDLPMAAKVLQEHGEFADRYDISKAVDEITLPTVQMRVRHHDGRWLLCTLSMQNELTNPNVEAIVIRLDRNPDRSGMTRALGQMASAAPTREVLASILDYVAAENPLVHAEELFVTWWDHAGQHALSSRRQLALDDPLVDAHLMDEGLVADWITPACIFVDDIADVRVRDAAAAEGFRMVWMYPIGEPGCEPLGVIAVWTGSGYVPELRPEMHLTIASHLVRVALLEAQRRRIMQVAAMTDPLTGLANRAGLREALDELADDGLFPVTAVVVDIDNFKDVNDRYGHDVGDAVLVALATRLGGCAAARATVARLGGDEFVIVAPGLWGAAIPDELAGINNRFSLRVVSRELDIEAHVSIGSATASDAAGLNDLLTRADESLYRTKRERHTVDA